MKTHVYLTLLLILIIAGCVPSLHQLWTKDTLTYDETIVGKYGEGDNIWQFTGDPNDKSYELVITETEDGKKTTSELSAHLVKLQGQLFFDFYPDGEIDAGLYTKIHLVAAHTFWKVEKTQKGFTLAMMDPEKIDELLEEKPEWVKHERFEDYRRVILTDSPKNLQQFLLEGLKVEGFFGEPEELEPVKEDKTVQS